MTKRILFILLTLCAITGSSSFPLHAKTANRPSNIEQTSVIDQLAHLKGVSNLTVLKAERFTDKCVFFFEQPIDHKDPSKGTFKQRVFVAHRGFDRPTVLVTEGYGAAYAATPRFTNELAELFETNIVVVEHRYFLESTPKSKEWQYLTAENSANDLHAIFAALETIYPGKWISTGVSKGGQTTMIYRTFFPNDMDISVPYVGPLCRAVEDGRHEIFLRESVGTPEERQKIQTFQIELLKRRDRLMPMFTNLCQERKYEFRAPLEEIYDYCVLEYPFAHWQYGTPIERIPDNSDADEVFYKQLTAVSSPDYFQHHGPHESFFVQAAHELGYYGYDTEPFKKWLTIKSAEGYLGKLVVPQDANFVFDKTLYNKICTYLGKEDPRMIFIYGEYDPWSAVAADVSVNLKNKKNIIVAYQPKGNHSATIRRLPEDLQNNIIETIKKWLE